MTEQPVEPITEQQFLGNAPRLQAYLPNGHRLSGAFSAKPTFMRPELAAEIHHEIAQARIEELDRAAADIRAGVHKRTETADAVRSRLGAEHGLVFFDETTELNNDEYKDADQPLPGTDGMDMMLTAENHAHSAVLALSCGELDEAIAWLQSSLAFAKGHRRAEQIQNVASRKAGGC